MERSLTPNNPKKPEKKTPLWRRVLKSVTVHAVNFYMILGPQAYGQDLMNAIGGAMNIVNQGFQQAIQQQQQAIAQAQLQQQMQQLQPKMVPSKYHPQCPVPAAVTAFPAGACDNPITDPTGLATADAFRNLALSYNDFFTKLTAESQNGPQAIGLQCVEEANKRVDAQIQDKINALTAMINQVKKETQQFEQDQQKIKEEMDKLKDILKGDTVNRQDGLADQVFQEFTPACQNFYQNAGKARMFAQGLIPYKNTTGVEIMDKAGNFQNNKGSYVKDINNQLNTLRQRIQKDGIGVASELNAIKGLLRLGGKSFDFKSADDIIATTVEGFRRDFTNIQRDLAQVGFNVDANDLNGDFSERMARFSKGAGEFFRKEAIASCVNGSGDTGIGLSTQQILDGLRHRSGSGSSTTLSSYRTALKNILDSDAFIEDKMLAIQRLDAKYGVGEIFLQVQGADATSRSTTPYGLYQQQIEVCKARIEQDETFSTKEGLRNKGGSVAERISDAERALKKGIQLERNFVNDLVNNIYNRVVKCDGLEPSQEKCSPNSGGLAALSLTNPQFCMEHASSCSEVALGCNRELNGMVQRKQEQMQVHAGDWNARVSGLVAKQEFFLNQIKAQVINDAEFLKRFVPGSAYVFPDDLFVEMPRETMNDQYGVALAGGGNVDNIVRDLPKKLDLLKKTLDDQRVRVAGELGEFLRKTRQGIQQDRQKWEQLKGKCEAAVNAYNKGIAESNKARNEAIGSTNNFCQKYNAVAQNPAAGCGQAESLFEDAMGATAGMYNPGATRAMVLEYQQFCESANNESNPGNDDGESSSRSSGANSLARDLRALDSACGRARNNDVLAVLRRDILARIPSGVSSDDRRQLERLLESDDTNTRNIASNFSSEFYDSQFFINFVEPYIQIKSSANISVGDAPARSDANGTQYDAITGISSDVRELLTATGDQPVCTALNIQRARDSFNNCASNENPADCYNDRFNGDSFTPSDNTIKTAAELAGALRRRAVATESGNIGERMRGTPCLAQQGFNGSSGFNLGAFDASILGPGMDVLGTLGR